MISFIKGKLAEKSPTQIVVDCNGVGYEVNISLYSYGMLPENESIRIYTYLQVREDAQVLFGFMDKSERDVFTKLISVSGIGASTARMMFSSLSPEEVVNAIANEDVETIKSVKGIGLKTAQRVIVDLKDKINKIDIGSEVLPIQNNTHKDEALSALVTLGYSKKQAEKSVHKIVKENPEATVEYIIKTALKNL
ncbi:Holliday junction branch migration protein RuvA [Mesohalobacter halotolerans]|uniref:Holliday junction branch migration complex subunit RuvA n=1 Tax=Mesohalobacter halotolerans TaxID=1883405 RepID=A0A4U5TSZ6_9FLAO|nr:Holliday junction branch migration protein RuvA [Mesohalobacter halotolerans]MBS3737816.1 Holliday junction branch migration protein RuvA [Psychroflexus sp.]TKS57469.1 Holliday junction branch migration protein RuvA [Mesohalobacter halotolerans]